MKGGGRVQGGRVRVSECTGKSGSEKGLGCGSQKGRGGGMRGKGG